jgi:hypothetical protein
VEMRDKPAAGYAFLAALVFAADVNQMDIFGLIFQCVAFSGGEDGC